MRLAVVVVVVMGLGLDVLTDSTLIGDIPGHLLTGIDDKRWHGRRQE